MTDAARESRALRPCFASSFAKAMEDRQATQGRQAQGRQSIVLLTNQKDYEVINQCSRSYGLGGCGIRSVWGVGVHFR